METPTKKIKAPISGVEIEIKDWITGADAEYIDEALYSGIKIQPDIQKKTATMNDFDVKSIKEQEHREIEKFIVSINGIKENKLKEVLSLPEQDLIFVKEEIASRRKKKVVAGE